MKLRQLFLLLALLAGYAHAQSPGEIAFWETVRDSKNAAELQAYIDQYPNGRFVVIAKARLAALQKPAAQPLQAAPAKAAPAAPVALAAPSGSRMPQVGDTWTYRLTYPKRFGVRPPEPSVRTHVVKVDAASGSGIVDQVLVDGAAAVASQHAAGACRSAHYCVASARVVGTETVQVPAGTFNAVRILVEESWRPGPSATQLGQFGMATANGGRTLTVWYAPEVKRAVKFSSRHGVGDTPPVDTHFDLELVSYQLK